MFFKKNWLHWLFVVVYRFSVVAAAAAKSLQSCLTLCDPIDGSLPGSSIPGILQARTLEWIAISFSNAWKWKVKVKSLSCVQLIATPWTAAYQAPPSMGVSRQEYWSGVPLPSLLVVAGGGALRCHAWASHGDGFSRGAWSPGHTGSAVVAHGPWRAQASVVMMHGFSCSTACGIFPDQRLNWCPQHWQADSYPLYHQGSPI